MSWPNDADGDVLRRLESDGFDFTKEHSIDFNIDFNVWPLSDDTIRAIENKFPGCEFIDPDEEDIKNGDVTGYVQFRIKEKQSFYLSWSVVRFSIEYVHSARGSRACFSSSCACPDSSALLPGDLRNFDPICTFKISTIGRLSVLCSIGCQFFLFFNRETTT